MQITPRLAEFTPHRREKSNNDPIIKDNSLESLSTRGIIEGIDSVFDQLDQQSGESDSTWVTQFQQNHDANRKKNDTFET
jgi:hypothetical protein